MSNNIHGSKVYRRRKETEDRQGMERRRKVVPRHRTDSWLWNHGKQAIFWTNICANLFATRLKQGLGMEPETGGSEEDDKPKEDGRKRKRRKGHGSKKMTREVRMEEIGKDEMVGKMDLGTDEMPVEMMEVEEGVKKEPGSDEKGRHEEMDVFGKMMSQRIRPAKKCQTTGRGGKRLATKMKRCQPSSGSDLGKKANIKLYLISMIERSQGNSPILE